MCRSSYLGRVWGGGHRRILGFFGKARGVPPKVPIGEAQWPRTPEKHDKYEIKCVFYCILGDFNVGGGGI